MKKKVIIDYLCPNCMISVRVTGNQYGRRYTCENCGRVARSMTADEKLLEAMMKLTKWEDEELEYCLACDKVFIADETADHMATRTRTITIRKQKADMEAMKSR